MGSPGLPNMAIQQLMQRLAAGQANRGAPGVATGAPPGGAGNAVQQQLAELKGADPQMGLKKIQAMISDLAGLINTYALRIPGASQALSRALPSLQRGLKEIQTAAQTMSAVGGPISMSAAQGQPPGGAAPSPGPGGPPSGPAFPTGL